MNYVLVQRMLELSEHRTRFERLKKIITDWKYVMLVSVGILTMKIAAEQLVMAIRP
jgi:hypothetical protein